MEESNSGASGIGIVGESDVPSPGRPAARGLAPVKGLSMLHNHSGGDIVTTSPSNAQPSPQVREETPTDIQ